MSNTFLARRWTLAASVAVAAAVAFGVFEGATRAQGGGAPSTDVVVCNAPAQLDYWSWDHYSRLWTHRCLSGGEKILASESDLIALPKNVVTAVTNVTNGGNANVPLLADGQPSLLDSVNVNVGALTATTFGDAPQMSTVVAGGLKKSSACRIGNVLQDANTASIPENAAAGCDHGTAPPDEADATATDEGGSVGVYAVTFKTGPTTTATFTWDVSRWAKGDILLGVGDGILKASDRDLNFKRYVALSDHQRLTAGGKVGNEWVLKVPGPNATTYDPQDPTSYTAVYPDALGDEENPDQPSLLHPTGRQTAGCAVDFKTGEPYFANFDFYDPGINVITRQAGNMSPAQGNLPYSDLSRRISTADFRPGDTAGRNVIDNTPESLKFDRNRNLYVGHEQPWYTGDGMVVDKDAPLEASGLRAPAGRLVFDSYNDQTVYMGSFQPDGTWRGTSNFITDPEGFFDSVRVQRATGSSNPYEAYFEDVSVPYPFNFDALDLNPFAWLFDGLGTELTNRIPWPRVYGRRLHRYVYHEGAPQPWSRANRDTLGNLDTTYYWPFTARTGVDWIDLAGATAAEPNRKPVVLYTSQAGDVYKFDTETGTQLAEWSTRHIFPSELHAFRLLPPGDGTDLVVAGLDRDNDNPNGDFAHNSLIRVKIDPATRVARVVQKYLVPNVDGRQPQWKALDISPDGKTMVAVAAFSTNVYRFDVSTGSYAILEGTGNASTRYESQSVCILWQYNAQQEICDNFSDDDGDGVINNGCQAVPELSETLLPVNDFYSTPKNVTLNIAASGVLVNDQASGSLSVGGISSPPSHGQVTINANGSFVYTPANGYIGEDRFNYLATTPDPFTGAPISKEATVSILIFNRAPAATDNSYTTEFNTPIDHRYPPCLGAPQVGQGCVPDDAANRANGILLKNDSGVDSDPDLDPVAVTHWGLGLLAVPPVLDGGETWRAEAGGMFACQGLAHGLIDAYCHTAQGGRVEVWSDGRFRYYPATGFSGADHFFYRVNDGQDASNWARVTITVNPRPTFPVPVAVGNAYETTTGFNLDVHYPPCIATAGRIETGVPGCPPVIGSNPNAPNALIQLTRLQTGYVDPAQLDSRGVQILQLKPNAAPPPAVDGRDADWADVLSTLRVHSWGEKQADMPGPVDLDTWELPAVGDDVNVCRGMAQGTTDAYCPTTLGGLLEIWEDGTFRYHPPNLATPQPDWFWYRVADGHGQLSNWAQVTINVRARMLVRPVSVQRTYGSSDASTNGAGYYDFLMNGAYTGIPQSIVRPESMSGSLTCTAWQDGTRQQPRGTVPVSASTRVGRYPITCEGETRPGYEVVYETGELTITPVPLNVKAQDKAKTYDGHPFTDSAPLTVSYEGFVGVEGPSVLDGTLAFGGPATTAVNANNVSSPTYSINPGGYIANPPDGPNPSNYWPITYESGNLTIGRAPLTVRAADKSKDYDGHPFAGGFTSSYEGLVNDETPAVLGGTLTHGGAAVGAVNANAAAGYDIVPGGHSSNNYDIAYVPGRLRIRPVGATVHVDDKTFDYDGNGHVTTCTVTGAEGSTLTGTLSYPPAGVKNAGNHTATCTFDGDQNHTGPVTGTGTITIRKIPLHIKASSGSKMYGNPFAVAVESYTGFIPGENAATALGTQAACDSEGSATLAPVSGNPYSTECSGAAAQNYTITYGPGTLTLGRRPASVAPNAKSKVYGDADPGLDGSASGFLPQDGVTPAFSRAAGQTVPGPYLISATLSPAGVLNNYDITYSTAPLTISKRPLAVTPDGKAKKYGKTNPTLTGAVTGLVFNDVASVTYSTTAQQTSDVGDYPITAAVDIAPETLSNYTLTTGSATLKVQQRLLKVSANDKSRGYGDPDPQLDGALDGNETNGGAAEALQLAIADGITPIYSTDVPQDAVPGDYNSRIFADVNLNPKLLNYHVLKTHGKLTITARAITVKADPKSKTYGDADPGLTYQIVSGSLLPGDNFTGALSRAAGVNVGTYGIQQNSLAVNANYTLTYQPDNLVVNPRPVTITAAPKSKMYGHADPALTYTVTQGSLVSGDNFIGTLSRANGENVVGGPYTINQNTVSLGSNYTLTYVPAGLTIAPRPIKITADSFTRPLGFPNPLLTGSIVSGDPFVAGGILTADGISGSFTTAADINTPIGTYPIVAALNANAKLSNYGPVTYVNGMLTIVAAPKLTLTKNANPINYSTVGQPIVYTYKIVNSGNVNITAPFAVTDDKLGVIACGTAALAPGASTTCSKTYLITQADINTGYITNKATAAGGNGVVSDVAQAWVFGTQGCSIGYPSGTAPALSSVVFNESEILKDIGPNFVYTGGTIRAWYADEHAMLLGIRSVSVKTSAGTTTTSYPVTPLNAGLAAVNPSVGTTLLSGPQSGTDVATWNSTYGYLDSGRPFWPSLFITDITDDPSNKSGDWQQRGTPIAPNAVYGTWKSATKLVDQTRTPWAITVTTDANPAKNNWSGIPHEPPDGFAGYENQGYATEIQWNASALGLIAGRTYRLQVMVHDGDQNKSGGDVGQGCMVITAHGSVPAPVADDDSYSTTTNTPISVPVSQGVLLGDVDPADGTLTAIRVTDPANGTVVLNADGSLIYTPNATFTGTDTFTYKANNGLADSNVATVTITVTPGSSAGAYTTFTQGGWGSKPSGGNPGELLDKKFSAVYPGGSVTIGSTRTLRFTKQDAIERFLPAGGPAKVLDASAVDPDRSRAGVIGGQLLAVQLNVDFSNAGITRPGLGNLKIKSGKLAGLTVTAVLALANAVVGGSGALPPGVSISDLNSALDSINRNFDNGRTNKGYLQ